MSEPPQHSLDLKSGFVWNAICDNIIYIQLGHEIEDTLDIDNRNSFTITTNKIQMRLYFVTVYKQKHSYTVCIYMVNRMSQQEDSSSGVARFFKLGRHFIRWKIVGEHAKKQATKNTLLHSECNIVYIYSFALNKVIQCSIT